MPEQDPPDAADSGDSTLEDTGDAPRPLSTLASGTSSSRADGVLARPRFSVQWRSFSGGFMLVWLLALGWLVHVALHGPGPVTELPKALLSKVFLASALAVTLSFIVPVSLLDDSSHHAGAWWIAWLWPPVMVLMLAADAFVIGGVTVKLMPLLTLLKKHP